MVYRSDCRYLPLAIHFSEVMPFFFHEKTDKIRIYSKYTKMAANGYWERKVLILRKLKEDNELLIVRLKIFSER